MLLHFYGGAISLADISELTIRQFQGLLDEMGTIISMQNGSDSTEPVLEGKAAADALSKLFPGKVKKQNEVR